MHTCAFKPLKYVLTTICICTHFPPAPYKQYCPTIVIVYVCPQIYANDSTSYASKLVLYVLDCNQLDFLGVCIAACIQN